MSMKQQRGCRPQRERNACGKRDLHQKRHAAVSRLRIILQAWGTNAAVVSVAAIEDTIVSMHLRA